MMARATIALVVVSLCALGSACSRDVEAAKREYVERGDRYVKEKNVDAAIIEYRNALQQDPRFGEAYRKLAAAYLSRGDGAEALNAAVSAADFLPDLEDAQLQAGELLLLSGRFVDARVRAQKVLTKNAKSTRAHVLLGNAIAGLKDVDSAIQQFEEAIRLDPNQSGIYMGLAALKATQGDRQAAEETFKQAIDVDPKSVTARLALAQFYWATERSADAEQMLLAAREAMPGDARANMALAVFYQATRRADDAEPYLRAALEADPSPRVRTVVADYYIARNRVAEAKPLLDPLVRDRRFGAMASLRLAGIAQIEGKPEEALKILDETLTTEPNNAVVLAAKSDLLLRQRKVDDASKVAEAAVAANPSSVEAHFIRGRTLAAQGRFDKAEQAFNNALKVNPRASAARVELARLKLRTDSAEATRLASEATQANPRDVDARLTLARAHVERQEYAQAQQILDELLRIAPKVAQLHSQLGTVHLRKRDVAAARTAFVRALALDPLDLEALQGMTTLDFSANRQPDAIARLDAAVQRAPGNAGLLMLAAQANASFKNLPAAERLLVKAIQLDPAALPAYRLLGNVYVAQKRMDAAREQFEKVAASEDRPVGALTAIGIIDLMENRVAEAQEHFEKVLKIDPQSAVAANNLAWIYAENGGSLDMALQMAQVAKRKLPNEAEVEDTLGWVYYKKGLLPQAITSLERSLELDSKNATAVYHLALAYEKNGDRIAARRTLTLYLSLDPASDRSADAKRRLQALGT